MFFCFVPLGAAQAGGPGLPEANPGRPTVSTPATLTPVGYLQFENGVQFASESPEFSRRLGINHVTKLTVHPRLQLILQSDPLVRSVAGEERAFEEGEVFAGAQAVVLPGSHSRPTVSLSYFRRLHEGPAPEIDIGTFRQSAIVLVSHDLFGFHVDANGIAAEQIEGKVHRAQFGQTISISHPLGRFTVSGELWRFSQPFLGSHAVGNLWAISLPVRKNLVLDAGFNHGFTRTSTRWEAFAGFTYLLPRRLWK